RDQFSVMVTVPRFIEMELRMEFNFPQEGQQMYPPGQQFCAIWLLRIRCGKVTVYVVVLMHGEDNLSQAVPTVEEGLGVFLGLFRTTSLLVCIVLSST